MNQQTPRDTFSSLLQYDWPQALAWVYGSQEHPRLNGLVKFYDTMYDGILIEAEIFGLPTENPSGSSFFAMHIHENGDCSDFFQHTGEHYNPENRPHPAHAGDLPPLIGNQGYAYFVVYNEQLTLDDLEGKSVVIHSNRDDFKTQPAGDAGIKIACGSIQITDTPSP